MISAALAGNLIREEGVLRVTTPTVRVTRTSAESVVSGVEKYLTPNLKEWDTNVFWNSSVNPSRLTFRAAGLYQVGGRIAWNAINGGIRYVNIRLNRTTDITKESRAGTNSSSVEANLSTIYYFNAGDYLEFNVFANVGSVTARIMEFWAIGVDPTTIS